MIEGFWSHPPHWEPTLSLLSIVVVCVDVLRETKVCNLENAIVGDENITRCQVAMNALFRKKYTEEEIRKSLHGFLIFTAKVFSSTLELITKKNN